MSGRLVVVTGALGQLGRRFCEALHDAGASVAAIDLKMDTGRLEQAFGERTQSGRLIGLVGDVTRPEDMRSALDEIREWLGTPFGLVNNAALDSPPNAPAHETGPFETYPLDSWDRVMSVNTRGTLVPSQIFGGAMAEAGRGSIVNIGSIYGVVSPDQSIYQYRRDRGENFYKPVAYAASKSALYNLTRYMSVYFGPSNTRANILTFAGVFNNQDKTFLANYEKKIPLRRGPRDIERAGMADPDDYVGAVIFLLSDASSYMTGSDIRIDGGYTAL